MAGARKEIPGSTTRLIIDHVRHRAGDDGVGRLLDRSGLADALDQLLDERRFLAFDEKTALFEAAAEVLGDDHVAFNVGAAVLGGPLGDLVPILRALGGPRQALEQIVQASDAFTPTADLRLVEISDRHAVIAYDLHEGLDANAHDCRHTMGLLSQLGPVFDLPPAEVSHPTCRAAGGEGCEFRVAWGPSPGTRRRGRRARREHLRGLTARFWELESTMPELVTEGDPTPILQEITLRAADAVDAAGHVLVLTDPDGSSPRVTEHGLVGSTAALVDEVFNGLVAETDERRLVVPLASDRGRYGHLVLLFATPPDHLREIRTIVTAHARRVAVTLDAARAIHSARARETTASVLLRLARSLSEVTTAGDVAARLAEATPAVTGGDQAAVLLVDPETTLLRVRACSGVPPELQDEIDGLTVRLDAETLGVPADVGSSPTVLTRAEAAGELGELMERYGEVAVALVPIRMRGRLQGMIACGWRQPMMDDRAALDERLSALADQAATALENATLLEQVRHQALHDSLTDLPNQTLFADRVGTEIVRAVRNRARVALGVLDLDRFKTVNDSLGHGAGDQLLIEVTHRLASAVRAPDTVARMGGDEFTLLLPDVGDGGERIVAERILEAFVQPFTVDDHRLRISPSIGFAIYPDDGQTFEQLLKCADVAMYRAKDRGRNTWASYASGMSERAYDRLALETDLYRALQRRELRVAFQPIARLADGGMVGSEALVRWAHPSYGLLLPEDFLPIATDIGLLTEIDGWVLRQACLELGSAVAAGTAVGRVAVNLSPGTLMHPALERLVGEALATGGIDPSRLVVEVNEKDTAERIDALSDALRSLRRLGVKVALDDFGGGGSALGRLERLPIDQLKVDPIFLAAADDPSSPAPVAEAIVAMGHGLGLEIVAEGVETEAQRSFAARVGFDLAQGWALGRPATSMPYEGERSRTA